MERVSQTSWGYVWAFIYLVFYEILNNFQGVLIAKHRHCCIMLALVIQTLGFPFRDFLYSIKIRIQHHGVLDNQQFRSYPVHTCQYTICFSTTMNWLFEREWYDTPVEERFPGDFIESPCCSWILSRSSMIENVNFVLRGLHEAGVESTRSAVLA